MKYDLVEQSSDRYIYMIDNKGYKFYLIIPNGDNFNIVLNLFDKNILDEVKGIPNVLDKAIVVPLLEEKHINYLKSPQASYGQVSGYFSMMINVAQGILVNNGKKVDSKVYFNNNRDFSSFINWYVGAINKPDRFVIGNIFDVNKKDEMVNTPFSSVNVEVPIGFDTNYMEESENDLEKADVMVRTRKREPGFVSYVLLGVMVAIMSLIFLYMLL